MIENNSINRLEFFKISDGLWKSLQKHLNTLYSTEKCFVNCLIFTDKYPFDPRSVDPNKLIEYWLQRNKLKDLLIDEVEQLSTLIKAIKQKNYKEEDKRFLFMLILGYMEIAESIFKNLENYKPLKVQKEEELANSIIKFDKIKKYVRLNIKGITPTFK